MAQHPLKGDVQVFVIVQVFAIAEPLARIRQQSGQFFFAHVLGMLQPIFDVRRNLLVQSLIPALDGPDDEVFLLLFLDVGFADGLGRLNDFGREGQRLRALQLGRVHDIARVEHEEADAGVGGDHFRGHEKKEGRARAQLESGEDHGQG